MPSPFPGMNPYIEREGVFHGFHERFCVACADVLVPQVRPRYIVDLDDHVYIHELGAEERRLVGRPDTYLKASPGTSRSTNAIATIAAPMYTRVPAIDEERLSYVKIMDRDNDEVITVIELLSPVNKASGRADYLAKRENYLKAGVGLVEIDLLRGGQRLPLETRPECDYCMMVVRPNESPRIGVWAIGLRAQLPIIPVPLRAGDADAKLDLQDLLHRLYDAAGYADRIYLKELEPPLQPDDREWAGQFVPKLLT